MTRLAVVRSCASAGVLLTIACSGARNASTIHASGHIEATEVRLAAKVGGRLEELPLREGDTVMAGQIVARLDAGDAQNDLARARADLDGADAHLRLLLAGSRSEDIDRAEAELARATADLSGAELDRERLEGLAERGSATLKIRDDARTRVTMLARIVAGDRAQLAELKAGPRPQEIDQARAQKAVAAATAAIIAQHIADATLIAPRGGTITERATEPGEVLAPGALLYVLTDVAHPWLNVYIDEPSLPRIHLGDPVQVRVDGSGQAFTGKVIFISQVAEFTPKNVQTPEERAKLVFRVEVGLENPNGVFKPGMPADAFFAGEAEPRSVPTRASMLRPSLWSAGRPEPGHRTARPGASTSNA